MMVPVENAEQKLKNLQDAWQAFKAIAHQASQEQRQAFSDILKEMDTAEIDVVRKDIFQTYDQ